MPFCFGGLTPEFVCEAAGPETSVALFRVRFVHTPGTNTADVLRFDYRVQSAAIFYLNGAELTRFNLCPAPAELTNQTPCCVNYIIQPPTTGSAILQATNLVPGTNLLAVAVLSSYCLPPGVQFDRDVSFGLEISGADLETGPVPAENPSMLQIAREQDDTIRLTWTGSGYALESTTNLFSTNATFNWSSVSDVSNPYLLSPSNVPAKAFRLRK